MDKIFISNQIKSEILEIFGVPNIRPYNLPGELLLDSLNNNTDEIAYRTLEQKLQVIAFIYQTGKTITTGAASKECTVSHCIRLVLAD